jgi:tetratricopeptide (TPR) repeat protein
MVRFCLLLTLTIGVSPLLLAQQSQPQMSDSARVLFEEAARAQQSGDLATAEASYRKFLERQPRSLEALANLGVVYANMGRYDDAIASYRKALEISYLNTAVRMNLALAFYKAGRYADAILEFDSVLKTDPTSYNALLLKADCYLQLGDGKQTVALLEPIATEHSEDAVFAYVLGMALLQEKRAEDASRYLDTILKRGESAEAHVLMGVAKQAAGDFSEAREEFKKAIDLNPSLPMAHSLLGRAYLTTGDRESARNAFVRELSLNRNDFEANLYLGVILKEDRDFTNARRAFDRALVLRPADLGAQYQVAALLLASNETEPAMAMLEKIVSAAPDFVEAHVSLATAYYRMRRKVDGDRERAIVAKLTAEAQARQPAAQRPAVSPQE